MKLSPTRAALWLALAAALALPALAQEWTAAPDAKAPTAAQQKELDAARAQLDAAAKRYGELARQYGADATRFKVERLLRKPVIGVVLAPDETSGVRIAGVTPDSAAAVAGVKSGDRIVAIDDVAIAGAEPEVRVEMARDAIGKHDAKSKVKLKLVRDGKEKVVDVTPRPGDRLMFIGTDGEPDVRDVERALAAAERARGEAMAAMPKARDAAMHAREAAMQARVAAMDAARVAAIAPEVRREIVLLGPDGACKGEHCRIPVIADALRWNGLNLASVDDDLGRYFGANDGVLVLSTGPELEGLRAGDVIRSVDGKAVKSPRDVMEALRGREAGSKVAVAYLRDRQPGSAQVTVPEPMLFRVPAPPAPPAPPAAPAAPSMAPPPPPAPPAAPSMTPPAPPAPTGFQPVPPAPPAAPAAPTPPPAD